jgi:hypothetical protein
MKRVKVAGESSIANLLEGIQRATRDDSVRVEVSRTNQGDIVSAVRGVTLLESVRSGGGSATSKAKNSLTKKYVS